MLPLCNIIRKFGISYHCYADDTQLYLKLDPPPSTTQPPPSPSSILSLCLEEIKAWMNLSFLQVNSDKTQAMLSGTPHQIHTCPITSISFAGHTIPLSATVTNLGVKLDPQLNLESHIKHICKTSFHLRNISKLRPTLTLTDAEKLVHAFVSSRVDYCSALLIGIPSKSLQRLQYIQNSAARILMRVRKSNHITLILRSLHWLPIKFRTDYKIALLTHQCILGHSPPYLKELLAPKPATRSLRSSNSNLLHVPKTKLRTMGNRAFCHAAPTLWNSVPDHLRAPQSTDSFKTGLKTHLSSISVILFSHAGCRPVVLYLSLLCFLVFTCHVAL
ncbi:uncharacterized protein [Syngnathus scovelli]|uniref:uncharacterized protein n=1 Tax=Syngnathus scovelli TaxID=161590 RepID=UPI0035CA37F3